MLANTEPLWITLAALFPGLGSLGLGFYIGTRYARRRGRGRDDRLDSSGRQ
jgi:hypothetical protein